MSEINYNEYEPVKRTKNIKDLSGLKVNNLTVIKPLGIKLGYVYWECLCDCGNLTAIRSSHLIKGNIKSCGCARHAPNKTHGQSRTRLGATFKGMMNRCYNKKHTHYKSYGGKGISICDEWLNNRSLFFEWALSHGYTDELYIDRINPVGNYEPNNCRWETNLKQQNNKTNNKLLTYRNETHTQAEWARIIGITPNALYLRLHYGGTLEESILKSEKGEKS